MRKVLKLWFVDMRQSWRDPITALVFFVPLFFGVVIRIAMPILEHMLPKGLNMAPYIDLTLAVMVLFPSVLTGMIAAFLMLDEKDEGTLLAIQVTPLPRVQYALYRLLSPVLLSAVLVFIMILIVGLVPISPSILLITAVLAALGAPLWAYVIFMFSGNKIEGMAIVKLLSLFIGIPLLSEVLPTRFIPILWPFPLYWPYKVFLDSLRGVATANVIGTWFIGLVIHIVYLALLLRFISKRSYS